MSKRGNNGGRGVSQSTYAQPNPSAVRVSHENGTSQGWPQLNTPDHAVLSLLSVCWKHSKDKPSKTVVRIADDMFFGVSFGTFRWTREWKCTRRCFVCNRFNRVWKELIVVIVVVMTWLHQRGQAIMVTRTKMASDCRLVGYQQCVPWTIVRNPNIRLDPRLTLFLFCRAHIEYSLKCAPRTSCIEQG